MNVINPAALLHIPIEHHSSARNYIIDQKIANLEEDVDRLEVIGREAEAAAHHQLAESCASQLKTMRAEIDRLHAAYDPE